MGGKETSQETVAAIHGREDGSWVQHSDSADGEKWSNHGYILRFIDKLVVCGTYV